MSQTIAARMSSLTAAVAVTLGLLFGVTGIAHASATVAPTTVASATATAAAHA
jgi:hypothetical protein